MTCKNYYPFFYALLCRVLIEELEVLGRLYGFTVCQKFPNYLRENIKQLYSLDKPTEDCILPCPKDCLDVYRANHTRNRLPEESVLLLEIIESFIQQQEIDVFHSMMFPRSQLAYRSSAHASHETRCLRAVNNTLRDVFRGFSKEYDNFFHEDNCKIFDDLYILKGDWE